MANKNIEGYKKLRKRLIIRSFDLERFLLSRVDQICVYWTKRKENDGNRTRPHRASNLCHHHEHSLYRKMALSTYKLVHTGSLTPAGS